MSAKLNTGREISGTLLRPDPGQERKLSLRPGSLGSGGKVRFYVSHNSRGWFLECRAVLVVYRPLVVKKLLAAFSSCVYEEKFTTYRGLGMLSLLDWLECSTISEATFQEGTLVRKLLLNNIFRI